MLLSCGNASLGQGQFHVLILSSIYPPETSEESEDISSIKKDSLPTKGESVDLSPITTHGKDQVFDIIYQINAQIDGNEHATKELGKPLNELIDISDRMEETTAIITEVEFHLRDVLDSGDIKPDDLKDKIKRLDHLVIKLKPKARLNARKPHNKGQQYSINSGLVRPVTRTGKPKKGANLVDTKGPVKSKDKLDPVTGNILGFHYEKDNFFLVKWVSDKVKPRI